MGSVGPKVSVCVITYNQKKFIRQCLQSIVDQVTSFDFEVIVGDDCSKDGTREIVMEFSEKYPNVVKPILHNKNVGGTKNIVMVHQQAIGEYIAHIDGDDFMLPGKLQIQADELDANHDCTICVHAMKQYDEINKVYLSQWKRKIPKKSNIEYLLMNLPFFNHSSKMYRSECRIGLDTNASEILDCYFHVHHALSGGLIYLDDYLGVYRINIGLATINNCANNRYCIPNPKMLTHVLKSIEFARDSGVRPELINNAKAKAYFMASYRHLIAKDFPVFKRLINLSWETGKVSNIQLLFWLFSSAPIILFWIARLRLSIKE